MNAVQELYDDDGRYLGKEHLPDEQARVDQKQEQSFEDFWATYAPTFSAEKVDIFGVLIDVPRDLPLSVTVETDRLQDSADIEDIKHMVGLIFNADVLDEWLDAGLTGQQFHVILAWGMANGSGRPTSFAEAVDIVAKAEKEAEAKAARGKAPAQVTPMNRADRRAVERRGGYRSGSAGR